MSPRPSTAILLLGYFAAAALALLLAPWWALAIVSIGFGLLWRSPSPGWVFWPGLLVGAVVYALGALWFGAGGGLGGMLGELFGLGSAAGFYALTALVGGLIAGTSALAGAYLGAVIKPVSARSVG